MIRIYDSCSIKAIAFVALLVGFAFPLTSSAAPAYAAIVGPSGPVTGDVQIAGREGTIEVEDYTHNVSTPYQASGESPGPGYDLQHRPVRLVMQVSQASPTLFGFWNDGSVLPSVTIEFWKMIDAVQVNYSTVVLNNAKVVGIIPHKAESTDDMLETVSFIYESITVSDGQNAAVSVTSNWDQE